MKEKYFRLFSGILPAALMIVSGCSKGNSAAPAPLSADKVPAVVNQTFNQSPDANKQLASGYASDFQNQDIVAAFNDLQKLRHQTDLTPEQKTVLARAMMTTMTELRTAATAGNPAAQKAMRQYMASR